MPNRTTISKSAALPINERSIAAVFEGLSQNELTRLAVDVVAENRKRLRHAQSLYESLEMNRTVVAPNDGHEACHKYRLALLELKIHHELVRIVVDELGYVPEVTSQRNDPR